MSIVDREQAEKLAKWKEEKARESIRKRDANREHNFLKSRLHLWGAAVILIGLVAIASKLQSVAPPIEKNLGLLLDAIAMIWGVFLIISGLMAYKKPSLKIMGQLAFTAPIQGILMIVSGAFKLGPLLFIVSLVIIKDYLSVCSKLSNEESAK